MKESGESWQNLTIFATVVNMMSFMTQPGRGGVFPILPIIVSLWDIKTLAFRRLLQYVVDVKTLRAVYQPQLCGRSLYFEGLDGMYAHLHICESG